MSDALLLLGILVGAPGIVGVILYNKLVVNRNRIHESWSNVDTELKRRHDLVPNLVAAVRGYAAHERALLEQTTRLRADAVADARDTPERMRAERDLADAVGRLLAVAESYPDLKASANYLQLQHALVDAEDRIQAARRFYNGNVRDYNNRVETFPSNLVASAFNFREHAYFELPDLREREAPAVAL